MVIARNTAAPEEAYRQQLKVFINQKWLKLHDAAT
jgi:hypothetical protein